MNLTIICTAWREHERNSLRGFADLRIAEMRLTIRDCAVHAKDGRQWIAPPSKPRIQDGRAVTDGNGRIQFFDIIRFDDRDVADAFSAAALKAIQDYELGIGEGAPDTPYAA